jgi:hypothetical protein
LEKKLDCYLKNSRCGHKKTHYSQEVVAKKKVWFKAQLSHVGAELAMGFKYKN